MPESFVPSRTTGLLIVLVIMSLWLVNIGHRVLQHPDEGRYAEIAREMAQTKDWLTPRLNGLKYFEKPPLQYWLTAATFDAFGASASTARLWPALAGLFGIAAIATAGYFIGGAALGWSAGLATTGMLWQVALSQILTLDAMLSALLAIAFAGFVVAQQNSASAERRRLAMWIAWAAMAGATLTKGLVGVVLPAGSLVIYTLVARDYALWRRLHLFSGLLIYLALAAPWFVMVSRANPEFAQFFFVHEHFARFLTTEHRRTGAVWYFVPLLAVGALPWITLLLMNVRRIWREGLPNALGFSWPRFALIWAAFVFVFFSASSSKLPSYILPMFPALGLVTGALLLRLDPRALVRAVLPLTVVGVILAVVALVAYPQLSAPFADDRQPNEALLRFGFFVRSALVAAAVGGVVGTWCLRHADARHRFAGAAALALSTLLATQTVVAGLDSFGAMRSAYDILRVADARVGDNPGLARTDIPFYQVRMYDQTVAFYLRRTTTLVEFGDELALGIAAEPRLAVPNVREWIPLWTALPHGFAIMSPDEYDALTRQGLPMRLLARDTRRAIVSRR
ncbi:MAG: glycosyltransferase family 39 protein [Pseudomonadota bacterium]|nr:glycosyltransferase family 39 protein [Pseudomonadota bacterium]